MQANSLLVKLVQLVKAAVLAEINYTVCLPPFSLKRKSCLFRPLPTADELQEERNLLR